MGNRRGGRKRRKASLDRHDCEPASEEDVATQADQLEYIADMLQGLKAMSVQANRPALTQLLELAYREAVRGRRAM